MKKNRKSKGFTILELVAVIAIIGIVSIMVVPKVTSHVKTANNTKYLIDAKTIVQAVEIYNAENPSSEITGVTTLPDIKTKLIPTSGKIYLSSWPKELKAKGGTSNLATTADSSYANLIELINSYE
jgi:type IV pilus assembly protein PilA